MTGLDVIKYAHWDGNASTYRTYYQRETIKRASLPSASYGALVDRSNDLSDVPNISRELSTSATRFWKANERYLAQLRTDSGCLAALKAEPDINERELISAMSDNTAKSWLQSVFSNLDSALAGWDQNIALDSVAGVLQRFQEDNDSAIAEMDPDRFVPYTRKSAFDLARRAKSAAAADGHASYIIDRAYVSGLSEGSDYPDTIFVCPVSDSSERKAVLIKFNSVNGYSNVNANGLPVGAIFASLDRGRHRVSIYHKVKDASDFVDPGDPVEFEIPGAGNFITTRPGPVQALYAPNNPEGDLTDQTNLDTDGLPSDFDGATLVRQLTTTPDASVNMINAGTDFIQYSVNCNSNDVKLGIYFPTFNGGTTMFAFIETEDQEVNSGSPVLGLIGGTTGTSGTQTLVAGGERFIGDRHYATMRWLKFVDTKKGGVVSRAIVEALTAAWTGVSDVVTVNATCSFPAATDSSVLLAHDMLDLDFWFSHTVARSTSAALTAVSSEDKRYLYPLWYAAITRAVEDHRSDTNLIQNFLGMGGSF